jgi:colanic acid/amylovoran biosynthesis protein
MNNYVILQIPNSGNNGSAMMAINAISQIRRIRGHDSVFYCDSSSEGNIEKIRREVGGLPSNIKLLDLPKFTGSGNVILSGFRRMIWIIRVISKIRSLSPHKVVILGGDDYSEYYSGYKIIVRLLITYFISLNINTVMLGHTIGPFRSWRIPSARYLLSKCLIVTRDEPSFQYCKNVLQLSNIYRGYDLAWLDLPKQNCASYIISDTTDQLVEDSFVVFTPTALVDQYGTDVTEYTRSIAKFITELARSLDCMGKTLVVMPHVYKEVGDDDLTIIDMLLPSVENIHNIVFIDRVMDPSECRALLRDCFYSISFRMHAAVSTIQSGKPSIAISYSVKYNGVLSKDLNYSDYVVEMSEFESFPSAMDDVLKRCQYIENGRQELIDDLAVRVSAIKERQAAILDEIFF